MRIGNQVEALQTRVEELKSSIDANVQSLSLETFSYQILALAAMERRRQISFTDLAEQSSPSCYRPAEAVPFEESLEKLKACEPRIYPIWQTLFDNGAKSYEDEPCSSCSVWGNRYAHIFRDFCAFHLHGRVLDIGIGPIGKPLYLQDYPSSHISGLEPLPMTVEVDFEVARGFAEFLPWPDDSFHTVIACTSLDHLLSLEKSFDEIKRVLTPDGCFLVLIASIEGAAPYDPKDPDLDQKDEFHLFHIDAAWFEPFVQKWFVIEEKLAIPNASFTAVMYRMGHG